MGHVAVRQPAAHLGLPMLRTCVSGLAYALFSALREYYHWLRICETRFYPFSPVFWLKDNEENSAAYSQSAH